MATVTNYTPEQTEQVLKLYAEGVSTQEIAETVGKGVRSIVAKLSREGVYKKAEKKSVSGGAVFKKADLIEGIAGKIGVPAEQLESLEKATKEALELVFSALPRPVHPAEE